MFIIFSFKAKFTKWNVHIISVHLLSFDKRTHLRNLDSFQDKTLPSSQKVIFCLFMVTCHHFPTSSPHPDSLLWENHCFDFFKLWIGFACSGIMQLHSLLCKASSTQHVCDVMRISSFYHFIPLYEYITIGLSILLLMDSWVISSILLLWIRLLWTFLYMSFCRPLFISCG